MITVDGVDTSYGDIQVLWDVSMEIRESDNIVALIGPNGAGKSTLLKTISGVKTPDSGRISLFGQDTKTLTADEIVKNGFVQIPEERNLFPDMTVQENLEMGSYVKHARSASKQTLADVYDIFPILEEKRREKAKNLSGGQQQILAIGRGLMAQPKILAFDEPSSGLAPQITERVFETITDISDDITVLLIEQHVRQALGLAERAYLMEHGRIEIEGTGEELLDSEHVHKAYLQGY